MSKIVKRSGKVAFYNVNGEYCRMKGFTEFTTNKSPVEYSRQYIDEEFKHNDVVGYNTSVSFSFDLMRDNDVHKDIADIFDNERTGDAAVREIVVVDFTNEISSGKYSALKRSFTVMPENEGDSTDAYTYSGNFKVAGGLTLGTAESEDEFETVTFTEDGSGT